MKNNLNLIMRDDVEYVLRYLQLLLLTSRLTGTNRTPMYI